MTSEFRIMLPILLSISVLSSSATAVEYVWQKISSGDVNRADLIKNTNGVFHTNNYYSPDGISWQATTLPPHNYWINASGYGDGTFVLTGATGQLWTSTDFENWTSRHPGGEDITDVVFGGGVFVARKYWSSSEVWVSADLGSTWQTANTGSVPSHSGYNFLAYGNSSFIRPANNGVHTSNDGISWNTVYPANIPADFSFKFRMYYSENAGFFLSNVVGRDGSEVSITTAVSSAGEEWQFYNATITTNITGDFQSSGFAGNLIFLTGYDNTTDQTEVWVSDNLGADWSKIESGPWTSTENDWAMFASNGTVLAVGTGSEIYTTSLSNSSDTDGDGVPDNLEITEGTDPNDANDFNEFSSGIVAWFPFTDSVENMAGTSVSASNNNAQLSYSEELQSPILSYGFNQWMEISGLGDYISGDPVTISGYYKFGSGVNHPREWGSGFKALMYSNTLPDGTNPQFRINVSGSPYQSVQFNLGGNQEIQRPSLNVETDTWYYFTVVVDPNATTKWKFFLNGALYASGSEGVPDTLNFGYDYWLGASSDGDAYYYGTDSIGANTKMRFYDRALSTSEVAALYKSEAPQFQIIESSLTWTEAKADAESRGGRLAVLNTQLKINAANSYLNDLGSWPNLWIGLTDQEVEGSWKWVNGEALTDNNWEPSFGEPNGGITENYAEIMASLKWNDTSHSASPLRGYLLEIPSNNIDTDSDGLLDVNETNTGIYLSETDTGTDPNNPDSDGDGLSDGVETNTGTFVSATDTGTDPNNADTDGDGVYDGDEVSNNTDPTSIEPPASLAGKSFILTALTGELSSVPDQVIFTADNFVYGFSGNSLHTVSYSYSDGTVIFSAEERADFIYTSLNSGTYEKGEIGQDGTFYVESTGTFEEANISLSLQTSWQRTESFDNSLSNDYWQIDTTSGDSVAYNEGELNFIFAEGTAGSATGYSNNREIEIDYAGALPLDEDWQIVIDDTYVSDSVDQFSMGYQLELEGSFNCEFGFRNLGVVSSLREVYFYANSSPYNPITVIPSDSDIYGEELGDFYGPIVVFATQDPHIQNGLNFRIQHLASTRELIYSYQPDGASYWTEVARINLSSGAASGLFGSRTFADQLPSSSENLFFSVDIDKYSTESTPIENIEIGGIEIGSYTPPVDTDGDGVSDNADPFPNDPLELEKLGPSDFQPKDNVGWIEVTYAYLNGQTFMPGIWHPIDENFATWFAFDDSWPPYTDAWPSAWSYYWNSAQQTSTNSAGDVGDWSHYKTSNPNIYTCKFDWTNGTNGYGFTYDGRIDLDNDGNQDGIQIRSGIQFPAEGSQLDFNQILSALSDNLALFTLPANFTPDDYDGDGTDNALDIDDDNDGIADAYDSTTLLYTVSNTSIPSSLSGYVEVYFSDYYTSGYGVWYGNGENSSINIWNDGVAKSIFNDTYSWDSQNLISSASSEGGGGIFRVNLKDKTNDAFFVFTYVSEHNELYPDDSGKGFFYDGRIDLDNNGVADGVQIQSGAAFPDSDSTLDFRNIYNLAVTNFIPIEVLNYTSNDKYSSDAASRILGQTDVTSNPSDYGLFTSSDISDAQTSSRTAGQQDVIGSPSDYNLMGAEGVFDMRVSQPDISMSGDKASMNFTIQSSNDLEEWNNEETIRRKYTMPSDKNFMRVSVGPQLEPEPLATIASDTYGDKLVYDESNNLYVNDENTPLKRNGENLRTDAYPGWNFYAVESTSSGYLCLLKDANRNAIITLDLDGNFLDVSIIADPSVYEDDFGQSLD